MTDSQKLIAAAFAKYLNIPEIGDVIDITLDRSPKGSVATLRTAVTGIETITFIFDRQVVRMYVSASYFFDNNPLRCLMWSSDDSRWFAVRPGDSPEGEAIRVREFVDLGFNDL